MKRKSNKVSKSSFSFIFSFIKFLLIAFLCAVSSLVLVLPFWLFADKAPIAYSIFVISVIFASCIALITKSCIRKFRGKTSEEKKVLRHNFLRSLGIFAFVAVGIVVPVIFVLEYNRIIALAVFLISFTALGIFSSCVKKI